MPEVVTQSTETMGMPEASSATEVTLGKDHQPESLKLIRDLMAKGEINLENAIIAFKLSDEDVRKLKTGELG